jgi:methyl-accepting chemotaxis protein
MKRTLSDSTAYPPTETGSFFRYHGVWAPGVRLFRQLSFQAKALLTSTVLLVPAVVLGSAYLSSLQDQINFTRQERTGVVAMQQFVPVLHAVIGVRNATRSMLGGHDVAADYSAGRARVDKSLADFEKHLTETGDPLQLHDRLAAMQKAWAATASSTHGADAEGRTVFGPVTEASLKVLLDITEESKVLLDPDMDTLYVINALFLAMPRTSEDLGQLWGWSTFAIAKGGLENPEQYSRFAVWSARASGGIEDAKGYFERAIAANAELKSRLDQSGFDEALKFQKVADPTEMIKSAFEPSEAYEGGRKAVEAYFKVFDSALPALDTLLSAREDRLVATRNAQASVFGLALLLGTYLFYCFARVMQGGLQEVAHYLDRMAEGDLTQAPHPWGRDEAASLMLSLGRMQTAVQKIVIDVRTSSESIVQASSEIASGSMDLSGRTEQAASELQQTAASLEQVNSTLGHTTANTQRAAKLAGDNAAAALRGGDVISNAVSTMSDVNAASSRIGDIIGVIDGIAFQTNILALNAAVEAARAGEQGRGFAVVASEVRSLAQRSASAAKEIKELINDSVNKVHSGTGVVERAGHEMTVLVDGAGVISTLLGEISNAAGEQANGIRQVGEAMTHLDTLTQQNAALVEQTAASSESLKLRAEELIQAVSRFRVAATA